MKRITPIFTLLALVVAFTVPAGAQSKFDKWPELKAFHSVMSATFHPSEKGNLQPIKERSGEMVEKAKALASSAIPKEFKIKEVEDAVKKLEKDSIALDKLVKDKASDEVIKKALTDLHDTFHLIVEKCQPDHHHDHNHDH